MTVHDHYQRFLCVMHSRRSTTGQGGRSASLGFVCNDFKKHNASPVIGTEPCMQGWDKTGIRLRMAIIEEGRKVGFIHVVFSNRLI